MAWVAIDRAAQAVQRFGLARQLRIRPCRDRRTDRLVDHRRKEPAMTDITELHARALDATGRIVDGVAADRWHAATPCAGWDARGLVNHLVAGNLSVPRVSSGRWP
jgi:hypothetical protein